MAYARYDKDCDWYIFWSSQETENLHNTQTKQSQLLAIWHKDHRADNPVFSYIEINEMLQSKEFSRIPGYTIESKVLIRECLNEFIRDVDTDFKDYV